MITTLIFLAILALVLNIIVIKNKVILEKLNSEYNPIQKIHSGYVPRIGGLIVIFCFYLFLIIHNQNSIFLNIEILIGASLIVIAGTVEDLFGKASPLARFLAIFFASFIFVYTQDALPIIEVPMLKDILSYHYIINVLFFSIGLTALANGFNMIDGMNGLVGFTSLGCIVALLTLINFILDVSYFQNELIILFLGLIVFLIFNFPLGKIFFGDTGAYWIGWVIGIIVIKIFTLSNVNTWGAIIIIFYPLQEVIFSFIRKLSQKKSPLSPDTKHLHLRLYFLLKGSHERGKKFNSFVTVCLMPFWFLPSVLIIWSQVYAHLNIFFILVLEITYLYYYYSIPKTNN